MARLIVLGEDGPLGKAGTQVWVDDEQAKPEPDGRESKPAPVKRQPGKKEH